MPLPRNIALVSCTTDTRCGWGAFTSAIAQRLTRTGAASLHILGPSRPPDGINGARLVHCLTDSPSCVLSADALARRARIPLVISTHGTYAVRPLVRWLHGRGLRHAYRAAARITAPSRFTADRLRARLGHGVSLTVAPNGVAAEQFAQAPDLTALRARYGPGPILLTVGALKPRKGQDVTLRAFAEVKRHLPGAVYLLIGEDQWRGELQRLAASLSLRDVYFLGVVRQDELIQYYHLCDMFVLTPRQVDGAFEGFGLVYLEAGAAAKPVIGARSGGVPDAVIDGVTGLLVPEGDVEATAAAMRRVVHDTALARALGAEGRRRAETLSWDRYVDGLCRLYDGVLA